MQTIPLGVSSLSSSRLAYGCWRIAGNDPSAVSPDVEARGRKSVIAAYEAGYTLFDNADIYCRGHAERIFGDAIREVPQMRGKILVATKCGVQFPGDPKAESPHRYDLSCEYILRACDASLKRMRVDTIDLYQLHRPDFLVNPEEVAEAFEKLLQVGKVRYFGVSNFRPSLVTAVQAACTMPLIVNQVEISLAWLPTLTDGTLDQCLSKKITPLAWSPLARGLLGDGGKDVPASRRGTYTPERILPVLEEIAKERGVSRTIVALAWLLKHPANIVPIVGSTDAERIRNSLAALDLDLTREEWYRLLFVAQGAPLP